MIKKNGEEIFFEGTFTKFLSTEERVPRYDYNQLTYKLTLSNKDVFLPEAIYSHKNHYRFLKDIDDKNSITDVAFYAMPEDRKVDGMIPIYQSKKRQLSLKGKQPLFYGFPINMDTNRKFLGTWEVQIIFAPFENSFNVELKKENGKLIALTNKEKFKITNPRIENDKLYLTLNHPEGTYELQATAVNGVLYGNWTRNDHSGSWAANELSKKWWGQYTDSVTDLFEFKSKDNKNFYYNTNPVSKEGFIKSDLPICKVWKNPSSQFLADFEIENVNIH